MNQIKKLFMILIFFINEERRKEHKHMKWIYVLSNDDAYLFLFLSSEDCISVRRN